MCERPLADLAEGDAFVPHLGGSVATIAVTAARHGARVALAGGAGDDAWGRWLRDRLEREGVDLSLFELVEGAQTPVAIVVSTIGAGDALTGVLLARRATSGFYPSAVAASLPDAVAQSSRACERWGALE
jgi:sugar/nucleoside kinase (ribokinase family)